VSRRAAPLAVLAAALLAVAGCSGGDDDSPSSSDVPSGAVAKVGDEEIGEEDLERQVEALARAQRPTGGGSPGGDGAPGATGGASDDGAAGGDSARDAQRRLLRDQALAALLMREALEQEAAERGVEISETEVAERWQAAAGGQFKTKKALRRFLGGQTEQDVLDQLRLQMLSEGIAEQVSEEAGGGRQGARAVARFQREFRDRWQQRTACAEGYDAAGCAVGDSD